MGEQQIIDAGRIEAERLSIFFVEFAAALVHPAIDQDTSSGTLEQVARARNVTVSAVK
jgi:hypothetical protein